MDNKEKMVNVLVFANEVDEIDKSMKYAIIPMNMGDYLYFKQAHQYIYGDGEYSPEVEQVVLDLDAALCKLDTGKAWDNVERVRSWREYLTETSNIKNVDYVIAFEFM